MSAAAKAIEANESVQMSEAAKAMEDNEPVQMNGGAKAIEANEPPSYYETVSVETEDSNATEIKKKKKGKPKKNDDVWGINYDDDGDYEKWSDKNTTEKVKSAVITVTKIILVIACLYVFICSISMLGDAFQILAGKSAGEIFANDSFLSNPITGLIIGILVTVLVQSSSTSTSIITTMVAAQILDVKTAVPIIMGTNIGTSVTNTIVSLSQSLEREEFRRAFAGATVHDVFNLLSVLILLPLEVVTGYLYALTSVIIESFHIQGGTDAPDLLKVLTDPVVKGIVKINKTVITLVAQDLYIEPNASMIQVWCDYEEGYRNITDAYNKTVTGAPATAGPEPTVGIVEATTFYQETFQYGSVKCKSPDDFLMANTGLSDVEAGVILLLVSLFVMCFCLIMMVKLLNSMLQGSVAVVIKKVINTNFKYPFGWVTGYLAIIVGAGLTFIVQSSSVFTSTLTPLVGLGVISLKRMFPLTLGANIGTTTTSLLAALASDGEQLEHTLQIALVHLFFNISGILLWYPIPLLRNVPIRGAKALGNTTAKYKWFAVLYLIFVFFLIPLLLLGLSLAHFWALMSVIILVLVIVVLVIVINILQNRKPSWLPASMRTWEFLPLWLRSLQPYDQVMTKYLLCCFRKKKNDDDVESVTTSVELSDSQQSTSGSVNKAYIEDDVETSQL